jgi:hypothetical protein
MNNAANLEIALRHPALSINIIQPFVTLSPGTQLADYSCRHG